MTTPPTHPTAPETAKHTPEPWDWTSSRGIVSGETLVAGCNTVGDGFVEDANCERIVACVNAFAGIAYPAVELAWLRASEARLRTAVNGLPAMILQAVSHLDAAKVGGTVMLESYAGAIEAALANGGAK